MQQHTPIIDAATRDRMRYWMRGGLGRGKARHYLAHLHSSRSACLLMGNLAPDATCPRKNERDERRIKQLRRKFADNLSQIHR